MKNTVLEVNIKKFKKNINLIQEYVPNKTIMPIIKANAYGTYINKYLEYLNLFQIVAVAEVQEAIEIRKQGYLREIFVLNQPSIDEIEDIIKYDITIGLSAKEFLKEVTSPIKVHLEIETGMNRTGIFLDDLKDFINEVINNPNIKVEGIYTHFSSADNDETYTNNQIYKFKQAVDYASHFFNLKYIHCSASNGILNFKEDISNTVRPGLILYGYEPFKGAKEIIPVEPITKLKTKITYIKDIKEGESISYNRRFTTEKPMKVATIPIGYADGLRRCLTGIGKVVVNNEVRNILGSICMDSCMIDVTDLDVKVGDIVTIWDNENITLDDIAKECNTINYEILSTISDRVERVMTEE